MKESRELSDMGAKIIESLFFIESFDILTREISEDVFLLKEELRNLLAWRWVAAYLFSDEKGDFVQTFIYDSDHLDEYSFLATREGMEMLAGINKTR